MGLQRRNHTCLRNFFYLEGEMKKLGFGYSNPNRFHESGVCFMYSRPMKQLCGVISLADIPLKCLVTNIFAIIIKLTVNYGCI